MAEEMETKNIKAFDTASLPSSRCSIGGSDVSGDSLKVFEISNETSDDKEEKTKM